MSDVIKRRENCLMVYVPEELDHHFAQQITKVVDEELEKGEISQLVFDFSNDDIYGQFGNWNVDGTVSVVRYSGEE